MALAGWSGLRLSIARRERSSSTAYSTTQPTGDGARSLTIDENGSSKWRSSSSSTWKSQSMPIFLGCVRLFLELFKLRLLQMHIHLTISPD